MIREVPASTQSQKERDAKKCLFVVLTSTMYLINIYLFKRVSDSAPLHPGTIGPHTNMQE